MKSSITTIVFVFISLQIYTQSTWTHYSQDFWVQDIKVVGDHVYVGNPTGFHVIDINTKETKLYQSVNSELRGSFVWELLETEDHIWVALNEGGIAKYDISESEISGRWEQYYTPLEGDFDSIHRARYMIEADDGTLWFDSAWGGKGFLNSIKEGAVYDHTHLFPEQPYDFSCHGSKRMYFRDDLSPLNYIDLETEELVEVILPRTFSRADSYTAFNDDLYVSFSDSLGHYLYLYDDDEWRKIDDWSGSIRLSSAVRGNDKIWLSDTQDPQNFISIDKDGFENFILDDFSNGLIDPGNRSYILNEDHAGGIWFVSHDYSSGETFIYRSINGELESYSITHSPLKQSIYEDDRVDFDCKGNLLLSGLVSIELFNPDSSTRIDVLDTRQFGDLNAIATDPNACRFYVAQEGHSSNPSYIHVFEDGIQVDTIVLESGWIGGLIATSDGKLVTSTLSDGIGFYDINLEEWTWNKDPLWDPILNRYNGIWSMNENVNGVLSFGTYNSLIVYDHGVWTTYDSSNSPLDRENIFTHLIDSKGNILVSYAGGIYMYNGSTWEYNTFYDPFKNYIASIFEDERGNYWLGTYDSGLLYWNGFSYDQYDIMNSGIPSNKIFDIRQNPVTNDLWLVADRGLIIFNRDDIEYKNGVFGKVFYDSGKDSEYDIGFDVGVPDVFININEESIITDLNGNYAYYPDATDSITIECDPKEDFEFTTSSEIITSFDDEDILDANFGVWKELEPTELEVDISVSPFLCSSEVSVWMSITNQGWQTTDGIATLTLPEDIEIISTYPLADNLIGNTASWSFDDLSYLQRKTFYVTIQGPSVEDILATNDTIDQVFIDMTGTLEYDGITTDYIETVPFLCAYDPNDKLSSSTGPSIDEYSLLGDDLVYTIRFQNEGNYKATNVIVTDSLSNHLDPNSIKIISSSHHVQTQLKRQENLLIFRFLEINLPPKSEDESGSQGFVKFRISQTEDLVENTEILNNAYIYFDNNAPIITNDTKNILVEELPTISSVSGGNDSDLFDFSIFPNPSEGRFEIRSVIQDYTYMVYNTMGGKVTSGKSESGKSGFDLNLPGMYTLVVCCKNSHQAVIIIKI